MLSFSGVKSSHEKHSWMWRHQKVFVCFLFQNTPTTYRTVTMVSNVWIYINSIFSDEWSCREWQSECEKLIYLYLHNHKFFRYSLSIEDRNCSNFIFLMQKMHNINQLKETWHWCSQQNMLIHFDRRWETESQLWQRKLCLTDKHEF